jgi:hypothetical protein
VGYRLFCVIRNLLKIQWSVANVPYRCSLIGHLTKHILENFTRDQKHLENCKAALAVADELIKQALAIAKEVSCYQPELKTVMAYYGKGHYKGRIHCSATSLPFSC